MVLLLIILRLKNYCSTKRGQNTSMIDPESIILDESIAMNIKVVKAALPSPKSGGRQRKLKRVAQKVQPLKEELADFLNEELSTKGSSVVADGPPLIVNWEQTISKNDLLQPNAVSGRITTTDG